MRRLLALAVIACVLLLGVGRVGAGYVETYYLKGFSKSGEVITAITDSIPAGTAFQSPWLQIFGASAVSFQMQATAAADSDSVVTIEVANIDTTAGFAVTVNTSLTQSGHAGQAVGAYSNYAGTGGVPWNPAQARTITVVPLRQSAVEIERFAVRWIRFKVAAPNYLGGNAADTTCCTTPPCVPNAACPACNAKNRCGTRVNTMKSVKMLVHVFYEDEANRSRGYYPLTGGAQ